jgi:hypothetical protein
MKIIVLCDVTSYSRKKWTDVSEMFTAYTILHGETMQKTDIFTSAAAKT